MVKISRRPINMIKESSHLPASGMITNEYNVRPNPVPIFPIQDKEHPNASSIVNPMVAKVKAPIMTIIA